MFSIKSKEILIIVFIQSLLLHVFGFEIGYVEVLNLTSKDGNDKCAHS